MSPIFFQRNQSLWPKPVPISYSCSLSIIRPLKILSNPNGVRSPVLLVPVRINSAIEAPTAGAVLNPVPLNPAATKSPATFGGAPITARPSGLTPQIPARPRAYPPPPIAGIRCPTPPRTPHLTPSPSPAPTHH